MKITYERRTDTLSVVLKNGVALAEKRPPELFQRRRHFNLKPNAMIPELSRSSDPGSGTGVVAPRTKKAALAVEVV